VIVPKVWDRVHIDDPPEGEMNPLSLPYQVGYDVIDHVSWLQDLRVRKGDANEM